MSPEPLLTLALDGRPEARYSPDGETETSTMRKMTEAKAEPKEGDLRVWWIPQIPMKPFLFSVPSLTVGRLFLEVLAKYDLFQLENNIKPDFANTGGLARFEDGEWCDVDLEQE